MLSNLNYLSFSSILKSQPYISIFLFSNPSKHSYTVVHFHPLLSKPDPSLVPNKLSYLPALLSIHFIFEFIKLSQFFLNPTSFTDPTQATSKLLKVNPNALLSTTKVSSGLVLDHSNGQN